MSNASNKSSLTWPNCRPRVTSPAHVPWTRSTICRDCLWGPWKRAAIRFQRSYPTRRQRHLGELGPWTEDRGILQLDQSIGSSLCTGSTWRVFGILHLASPSWVVSHPLKCRAAEVGLLLDKISSRNPKSKQVRTPQNPPSCFIHAHAQIYQTCSLENSLDFRRSPRSSSITVLFAQIADCRWFWGWALLGGPILEPEEGMSGPLDRFARPCEYERFFPLGHYESIPNELADAVDFFPSFFER